MGRDQPGGEGRGAAGACAQARRRRCPTEDLDHRRQGAPVEETAARRPQAGEGVGAVDGEQGVDDAAAAGLGAFAGGDDGLDGVVFGHVGAEGEGAVGERAPGAGFARDLRPEVAADVQGALRHREGEAAAVLGDGGERDPAVVGGVALEEVEDVGLVEEGRVAIAERGVGVR
ncbi:MAG: hypothetical protein ACK56F_20830, partial [bacterium]